MERMEKGAVPIHLIYTKVSESILDFPDGSNDAADCGDHNAVGRGNWLPCFPIPIGMPGSGSHAMSGE